MTDFHNLKMTSKSKEIFLSLFEYYTPKIVLIKNKKVGALNRLVQLAIISYIIGYAIVYNKGYQDFSTIESSVTTKVKGVVYTNFSETEFNPLIPDPSVYRRIWDTADYIVPPSENNAFFVITNIVITSNQTQSACPEDPTISGSLCKSRADCNKGISLLTGNGVLTGKCVQSDVNDTLKVCQIQGWCPVERDVNPLNGEKALLADTKKFTVLIKNFVDFPKFKIKSFSSILNEFSCLMDFLVQNCLQVRLVRWFLMELSLTAFNLQRGAVFFGLYCSDQAGQLEKCLDFCRILLKSLELRELVLLYFNKMVTYHLQCSDEIVTQSDILVFTNRRNIPDFKDPIYLKQCNYHPEKDPLCPIFVLKDIVPGDYDKMAVRGAAIAIIIQWECNFDFKASNCYPTYKFRRLDDESSPIAPGLNFRYAHYYQDFERTMYKAYGIKFIIMAQGRGGKFNLVPLLLNIGSGLGLLAVATILCDLVVLYIVKKRDVYKSMKYQSVADENANNPLGSSFKARNS